MEEAMDVIYRSAWVLIDQHGEDASSWAAQKRREGTVVQ
jgi:hypothetical protein